MYPFSQAVTPAVRSHLDAHVAFLNDMSKSLSRSFQNFCELNIQLSQTLLEESNIASQQFLTREHATDLLSVAASRAQPASDKLRAYQQHVSRIAADAQVDLARVTEQHVHETSRTARALADEVARNATEDAEYSIRQQQETMKNFRDPFVQAGAALSTDITARTAAHEGSGESHSHGSAQKATHETSASMQFADEPGHAAFEGNAQGGSTPGKPVKPGK
jgi:phasin family protein